MPILEPPTLRRRMHILERAQSELSIPSKASDPLPDSPTHTHPDSSLDEDVGSDTDSQSEGEEEQPVNAHAPTRPAPIKRESSRVTSRTKSWYEFDLAVLLALLSPLGNWLTGGGDYIKNLLLIALLVYYLHQIIEVPWSLYLSSRPRRHPHRPSPSNSIHQSELHRIELFFLFLSVISPFFGAYLLRFVIKAVTGEDVVSWFSTTLFVLATGIRPWSHLSDRLSERISDLHDVIHYPDSGASQALFEELETLKKRLDALEKKTRESTEEVYDYLDETVDVVERAVKRQDKKYEGRIRDVEVKLEKRHQTLPTSHYSVVARILPTWLGIPSETAVSPRSSKRSSSKYSSLRSNFSSLETIQEERSGERKKSPPPPPPPPISFPARVIIRMISIATLPLRIFFKMIP